MAFQVGLQEKDEMRVELQSLGGHFRLVCKRKMKFMSNCRSSAMNFNVKSIYVSVCCACHILVKLKLAGSKIHLASSGSSAYVYVCCNRLGHCLIGS